MIGKIISHYKILEKLGEGGMGIVYKAEDIKLKRIVALKFLPRRLEAHEPEQARFLQEAQAAAALNHTHICTVYDIAGQGDQQFIVMEYIDGKTLKETIQSKFENFHSAIQYAIQIGEALQEAHHQGIVHRDVKTENIMVNSKDQIKVMDFGLAKLKDSLKLTKTSSTVGTLAYMAPEQIQGAPVDARSDIFSFGVVLYEMLTGHLPFRGEHEAAMMYSIVNEDPEPIQKHLPDISSELIHIVNRALEKDPEDRYQTVHDMVIDLRRLKKETSKVHRIEVPHLPPYKEASITHPRQKWKIYSGIVIGLFVIFAIAYIWIFRPMLTSPVTESTRKMLAVLPFDNLGSPEREYFTDGLTDEVINKLSGLSAIGVIDPSSSKQYKKTDKTVKEIGKELGVEFLLQGNVRWEKQADGNEQLRISARLTDVAKGIVLWSQSFDELLTNAFKLQSDIAGRVASTLNISLAQSEQNALTARPTENPEAYDYYLKGNEYFERSYARPDIETAIKMYEKAVQLDPKFADAYARMGMRHLYMYWINFDPRKERLLKAKRVIDKAIQLKSESPETQLALAYYYYWGQRKYEEAIAGFENVLKLQPSNSDAFAAIGYVKRRQGKFNECLENMEKASMLNPRSQHIIFEFAITYIIVRQYFDAEGILSHAIEIAPYIDYLYTYKALLYRLWKGSPKLSREVLIEAASRIPAYNLVFSWIETDILERQYQEALSRLNPDYLTTPNADTVQFFLTRAYLYYLLNQPSPMKANADSGRLFNRYALESASENPYPHARLSFALALLGRKEEAPREAKRAVELLPIGKDAFNGPNYLENLMNIYIILGMYEEAITQLEYLLSIPSWISVQVVQLDPRFDPLRNNPRFQTILKKHNN